MDLGQIVLLEWILFLLILQSLANNSQNKAALC